MLEFCAREPGRAGLPRGHGPARLGRFLAVAADDGSLTALCHARHEPRSVRGGLRGVRRRRRPGRVADDHRRGARGRRALGGRGARAAAAARRPARPAGLRDLRAAGGRARAACAPRPLDDLERLLPACAAAHREELGVDPLAHERRRRSAGARATRSSEGRSWLWLEDGVILLQGGGVGLDAGGRADRSRCGSTPRRAAAATERAGCAISAACCSSATPIGDALRPRRERAGDRASTSRSGCAASRPTARILFYVDARSSRGTARASSARAGALNGDVTVPCGLTPAGVEQARRLGAAAGGEPFELCVTSEFERDARRPPTRRSRGRDVPRLVVPELNDPRYGPLRGRAARRVPRLGGQRAPSSGRRRARAARAAARSSSATRALPDPARPAGGGDPRRRPLAAGRLRAAAPRGNAARGARAARRVRDAVSVRRLASSPRRGRARATGSPRPSW